MTANPKYSTATTPPTPGGEGPVGTIHCLNAAATGMRLDGAVEAFLTEIPNANTARAYSLALRALVTELGAETLTINV